MKGLIKIFIFLSAPMHLWAQQHDIDGTRPSGSSVDGVNVGKTYVTNIQLTAHSFSGSHGLLFNAYKASSGVTGSLKATGNTEYANNEGSYSGGAGAIMFFGNGGNMDFLISPTSEGAGQDISWGETKMRIRRDGNVGIGTTSPSAKLEIMSSSSDDAELHINTYSDNQQSIIRFQDAGENTWGFLSNYPGAGKFTLFNYQNSSHAMVIDSNGNLGIGTTSPDVRLTVSRDTPGVISRFKSTGNGGINGLRLEGKSNDGSDHRYMDIAFDPESQSYGFGAGSYSGVLPISSGLDKADIIVNGSGNVGIGTTSPDSKLTVKGDIHAEEVKIDLSVPGPDYVFEPDYNLRTLEETEVYIQTNKHLPEIPSAKEMEANGVQLGEMNILLLKKIEELTLHLIAQKKELYRQQNLNTEQQERISRLEKDLKILKNE